MEQTFEQLSQQFLAQAAQQYGEPYVIQRDITCCGTTFPLTAGYIKRDGRHFLGIKSDLSQDGMCGETCYFLCCETLTQEAWETLCGIDRQQGEAVAQSRDNQCANHGADHRALAAHEGCAADNTSCDSVGVIRLDCVGTVADAGTTDGYDTCQSCHESRQRIAECQNIRCIDTGQTSSFHVTACTVDGATQRSAGQQDVHDDVDDNDNDEANREAADGGRTQCHDAVREAGYHLRRYYQKRCAPQEVLHAQRRYERMRQVQTSQQQAVNQADQGASYDSDNDEYKRVGHTALDEHTTDTSTECCICTNRQVDTCGNQAQQHTGGQQCCKRRLLQNRHLYL